MEKLEINQNDQNLDTNQMPATRNTFRRTIAGFLTLCTLYSGSIIGPLNVNAKETESTSQSQSYDNEDPKTIIEIPDSYKWEVSHACGKETSDDITIGDLRNINNEFMSIVISDDSSLEWLNYIKGINYLYIIINTDDTSVLKDIKKLQGIKELYISTYNDLTFTNEDFKFVENSKNITTLTIDGFSIEPGFLEKLTHLNRLSLMCDENYEVNFKNLTFLKELDFSLDDPYDVAIDFTKDEYDYLRKSGVKITFNSQEELNTYLEINERLDEIVASLNLNENSSDQEKLDAILIHVLENLSYDEEVAEAIFANTEHKELSRSFYQGGALYGALEKDSAICGNYAAYVQALSERVDLPSYYLTSSNHAWNLITIDGEEYYVDATWLDGSYVYETTETTYIDEETGKKYIEINHIPIPIEDVIATGNTETLEWYMADPENYPYSKDQAESHEVLNLPSFIKINPAMAKEETQEVQEIIPTLPNEETITEPIEITDEDKFEVTLGDKKWIIGGAAAIGIMVGLGGAIAINTKKKKEAERRRKRQQMNDMFGYGYDSYGTNNYTSNFYGSFDTYDNNPYSTDFSGTNNTSRRGNGKRGRR